jgi:CheY-like chemotaxis protein
MSQTLADAFIVVVEDDPNANLITLDLLRMGGAQNCFSRRSVESAMVFSEKLPRVDLFLVDINMPILSGYDMLRKIREHAELSAARVVALTAGTQQADVAQARQSGFDGFLSKPLKPNQFADQVTAILDGEAVWDWR